MYMHIAAWHSFTCTLLQALIYNVHVHACRCTLLETGKDLLHKCMSNLHLVHVLVCCSNKSVMYTLKSWEVTPGVLKFSLSNLLINLHVYSFFYHE